MFKLRSQIFQIQRIHIRHKHNKMRVSHRNGRPVEEELLLIRFIIRTHNGRLPQNQRLVHENIMISDHRNHTGTCFRLSHINLCFRHLTVINDKVNGFNTAQRFNGNRILVSQMIIIYVLCHAADPVSAHLSFRTVSIKHTHFKIGHFRRTDQNQSVASYTIMIPAYVSCHCFRIGHFLLCTIYVNIIVSAAMHFGKFKFHHFIPLPLLSFSSPCIY